MPSSSDFPAPAQTGLEVRPFRALTYRRHDPGHLALVSSPAYDLVTAAERERLAAADPHNIVRLILPRVDPDPEGIDVAGGAARDVAGAVGRFEAGAAAALRDWQRTGVLLRDPDPALWLYEMRSPDGGPATTGWLAAVGLPADGSRAVLPHEDTYAPAVAGRQSLLAATATDLEPIVLAHDLEPALIELTTAARRGEPSLRVADTDGVEHRMWRVTDRELCGGVITALGRTEAVIADGHHRFAAARAHQRQQPEAAGAAAILALLTPMGAGGLRVQAIHRVVPELRFDAALAAAARGFVVRHLEPVGDGLAVALRRWQQASTEPGFLVTDGTRLAELAGPSPEVLEGLPSGEPAAWRNLDVVLAHHGLIAQLWGRPDDPGTVLVAHDVDEARQLATEQAGVAVLLRSPSPADVATVARAGALMPRKSTLFVPKPRTGLVLRPHDD